jgi:hypothetical protein
MSGPRPEGSPDQVLSYLGIEKADMPQTTHGRMAGLMGAGLRSAWAGLFAFERQLEL